MRYVDERRTLQIIIADAELTEYGVGVFACVIDYIT